MFDLDEERNILSMGSMGAVFHEVFLTEFKDSDFAINFHEDLNYSVIMQFKRKES